MSVSSEISCNVYYSITITNKNFCNRIGVKLAYRNVTVTVPIFKDVCCEGYVEEKNHCYRKFLHTLYSHSVVTFDLAVVVNLFIIEQLHTTIFKQPVNLPARMVNAQKEMFVPARITTLVNCVKYPSSSSFDRKCLC